MYVSSPSEFKAPAQPPISLRLKRINIQPGSNGINQYRIAENQNLIEKPSKSFSYVCSICSVLCSTFEKIHDHWIEAHAPDTFGFCITERVRCIFCDEKVTFYSIREHMLTAHRTKLYAFAKHAPDTSDPLLCGICSTKCESIEDLQKHFRFEHPTGQRPKAIEPMPSIDDQTMDILTRLGYCNGVNKSTKSAVVQYKCFICNDINPERLELIKHMRTHLYKVYQCLYCVTKTTDLSELLKHHIRCHNSTSTEYRVTNARDNLHSYYQIKIMFANGLQMILGDLIKTKYGQVEELIDVLNEMNGFEKHSRHSGYSIDIPKQLQNGPRKIGDRRRQTLL